jgi:hypothetical protein
MVQGVGALYGQRVECATPSAGFVFRRAGSKWDALSSDFRPEVIFRLVQVVGEHPSRLDYLRSNARLELRVEHLPI